MRDCARGCQIEGQWLEMTELRESARFESADGTVRMLMTLHDGKQVECVFIPEKMRDTVCISSQVGCAVDCQFCMTAKMGLERNLSAQEIAGQVAHVIAKWKLVMRERPFNVVMMGQGEPLLNLDAVLEATAMMMDQKGLSVAPRRISLSTSGIIPKIEELGRAEKRPRLAVSLNASHQEQRESIMPITKKWRLDDLIRVCKDFPLKKNERILFEYVMLDGLNDTLEDARRVVELLRGMDATVNLIAWNAAPGIDFKRPSDEKVSAFQEIVQAAMPCYQRKPRGRDISAACGQLKLVALEPAALVG